MTEDLFADMRRSDRVEGIFLLILVSILFVMVLSLVASMVVGELLILLPICILLAIICIFVFAAWAIVHHLILGRN